MTDGTAGVPLPSDSGEPTLASALTARLAGNAFVVFRRLPIHDQRNFVRWVDAGASRAERARRVLTLRDALNQSPLAWESRPNLPNSRG